MLNPVERPILVFGHRGARARRPENTLPGFEYAIAAGADALELDVAVTRDNVVVVSHDPVLNRSICQSPGGSRIIRELTYAELGRWDCGTLRNRRFPNQLLAPGARIPRLDEVLALAERGGFLFNIEVKCFPDKPALAPDPDRFAELVWHVVRARQLERRVIVQSFDFRVLEAMRRIAPEVRLAALYVGRPRSLVAIAHRAGASGVSIVAPHHRLATVRRVRAAHAAGLEVVVWTANRPRDWKRLVRAHVDGIITDDPAALLDYLETAGLRAAGRAT